MSPLETGPSSARLATPAEGQRAACLPGKPEHTTSGADDEASNLAPRPSLLRVLLRALAAWPT